MITAIITAGGTGDRSQLKVNKNLFVFDGSTVIQKTVKKFLAVKKINKIIVTAPENLIETFKGILCPLSTKITVICGGETRSQSVKNGLDLISDGFVLIHDGARPFVSTKLINKCITLAKTHGTCIPSLPVLETLGEVKWEYIHSTMRTGLLTLQTPQVFRTDLIKKAYELANGESYTDDCGIYTQFIAPCYHTYGEQTNKKLTYKPDFEALLPQKSGIGFDIHRLVEGRKLVLGGVTIPHNKGLLGHSDADCLIHALMDAMLTAVGLNDIGHLFPDTDIKYKDIDSTILLKKVLVLVKKQGYKPVSACFTIMAEKPKLTPYLQDIKENVAKLLKTTPDKISISCTTFEGLGDIGAEQAIATNCLCYLSPCL